MFAREIRVLDDLNEWLTCADRVTEMRAGLLEGDLFVFRKFISEKRVTNIREYLKNVGSGSLPNFQPVTQGVPNFHRVDRWDPRAHVKAGVHSFSFFPWNQDVLNLFEVFKPVYQLKNLVSGLPADSFIKNEPDLGCTARMSAQYYPKGIGGLNRHQDPFDYHQITVPTMFMSQKGKDFQSGGAYVETSEGERIVLDDMFGPGDVAYFNAKCFHGVERIDPDENENWLSWEGRWILLFAVNKLSSNKAISESKDLGS